jgi:AraC family transcriptional regulator
VPEHLHSSTLFSSPLVTVSDWRCRPTESAFGAEEESSGQVLIFPRTGLFVERRSGRGDMVGDSTRVHFLNRHETYRIAHPVNGGDDCTSLRFNHEALLELLIQDDPSIADRPSAFRLSSAGATTAMALVLHRLRRNLLRTKAPESLAVEEDAAFLLTEANAIAARQEGQERGPCRQTTQKAHRDLAYAARVVLAKMFREKVTLSSLARSVFSSPFHLARVFRRETGLSLHAQLNRLRLRQALEEIADGVPDLTRLALELGFSSHSHFTCAFKREFGDSPSGIRRRLTSVQGRRGPDPVSLGRPTKH